MSASETYLTRHLTLQDTKGGTSDLRFTQWLVYCSTQLHKLATRRTPSAYAFPCHMVVEELRLEFAILQVPAKTEVTHMGNMVVE